MFGNLDYYSDRECKKIFMPFFKWSISCHCCAYARETPPSLDRAEAGEHTAAMPPSSSPPTERTGRVEEADGSVRLLTIVQMHGRASILRSTGGGEWMGASRCHERNTGASTAQGSGWEQRRVADGRVRRSGGAVDGAKPRATQGKILAVGKT